jgi:hypothetical protein
MRIAALLVGMVLLGGCAATIQGDVSDLAKPVYFDSADTINWLADNDPSLLESAVAHNKVVGTILHGDFCDVTRFMLFDSADTINWLADNDPWMLRSVVAHNETHKELCNG